MKRSTILSLLLLVSLLTATFLAPVSAEEPSGLTKSLPQGPASPRAPRPEMNRPAPAVPEPDYGGAWQFGPNTGFQFTRFDGEYYPGDGLVYFMGGRLVSGATPDTDGSVWTYNPVTGVYTDTGTDIVTPVSNYAMNLLQDGSGDWGFYIFGGRPTGGGVTDAVQVYYPDTNTAVQLDPADNYPGSGSCTSAMNAVHGNLAYLAGGFDPAEPPYNWAETWVFDPTAAVGSKWSQITTANLSLPRAYIMSAVVDDTIYAIGGNWYDGATLINVTTVEVLDTTAMTPTWTLVAPLPEECSSSRAYGFDSDSMYVDPDGTEFAGKIVSGCGFWSDENNHVFVYDTALDFWDAFPFFGEANGRRDHAGAFIPSVGGAGTPGMWVWGGINEGDANVLQTSEYYGLNVAGECNILLVEDDWDWGTRGGTPYYTSTLEYLGYAYDHWDTAALGPPTAGDLAPYNLVIWWTGYDWADPISSTTEGPALMAYMDGGGSVFMSSQEQEYAYPGSQIMSDYFWVDSVTEDLVLTGTMGNAADPLFGSLGAYPMGRPDQWDVYWPTAEYQGPYDDAVTVKAGGFEPMVYSDTLQANSTRFEGATFKAVYFGYPFEWVVDLEDRAEIMNAVINWVCFPVIEPSVELIPPGQVGNGIPGAAVPYTLTLINGLGQEEWFTITYSSIYTIAGPDTIGPLADGATADFVVTVTIPADANCYESDMAAVTAQAQSMSVYSDTAYIETVVNPAGMGNIMGTVYDMNTGLPLENAYVELALNYYDWTEYYNAWTDANGEYAFTGVAACTYDMYKHTSYGYFSDYGSISVMDGVTHTVAVSLTASIPNLDHDSVSFSLPPDSTGTYNMYLMNDGSGDLHYYFSEVAVDSLYPISTAPMPGGVNPQVYADLAGGTGRFIVYMAEQADLSQAYYIDDWSLRGQYVFDALRSTAERTQAGLLADLDAAGATYEPHYIVNAVVVESDLNMVERLIARADVAYIGPDGEIPAPEPVEMDPLVDVTPDAPVWNIAQINADDVWSTFGFTGTGVIVANIDTGVMYDHPALVNQYRGNMGGSFDHNYNWWDPYGDMPDYPYDWHAHGSHTMGTMLGDDGLGNQIGIAPGAQWLACNGFWQGGSGYEVELLECAEFLLAPWDLTGANPDPDMRPHVINNSWGGGAADWWYNQAIYAWHAAGIFDSWSAGNSGPACETIGSPDYANTFQVGATDVNDNIASFSSRGPTDVTGLLKPDVSAPGVSVISAYNNGGYGGMSGTSMASPHVAGTAALLLSAQPELIGDFYQVGWLLEQTALPLTTTQECGGVPGDQIPNNTYGWGRIDAFELVSVALSSNWDIPWVDVNPPGGIVPPLGGADIHLDFDSTGLTLGECYTGTLQVEYNDPYVMEEFIKVELCIEEIPFRIYLPVVLKDA
ncbi:MAG: S8 family serine peptidase [Anaerolineae bacterium]|nr:S8 family serine peptidase [Anaerolineae bacterium]